MQAKHHLLAIDQGTTGTTVLVLDRSGATLGRHTAEFAQHYPQPGWVEHDPDEILASVAEAVAGALASAGVRADQLAAIGITNQRETTLLWDRASGAPVHRAIVWQCRRTSEACAALRAAGHEPAVREATGLVLDPYFSGTKVAWLLDHVPEARRRAERGELAFGTVDSFLVARLSGGSAHVTDVTNASRTLLMNLRTLDWDEGMLKLLRVPRAVLPRITGSAEEVARTRGFPHLPDGLPVTGVAGDQQAAMVGQACFAVGDAKCTYGTGAFVLLNVGERPRPSRFGLLSTVAWRIGGEVAYALEGSAFIAGAAVQWLRDGLGLVRSSADIEPLARQVPSSEGVYFVPALAGLGAPHWDAEARGVISGITRGTTAAHLARATLEAVAHQVTDLCRAMTEDFGHPLARLRVDGGAARNDLLMQLQSDLAGLVVERPRDLESTARGAAMLAGLGAGLFADVREAARMSPIDRTFQAGMTPDERERHRTGWAAAVRRCRTPLA